MKSSKMDFVQKPPNPEINGAQIRYIIVTRFFYCFVIFAFQIDPYQSVRQGLLLDTAVHGMGAPQWTMRTL